MGVPREQTQPPGDQLLSYQDLVGRLQKLSTSPRVKLQLLDRSYEGRGIHAVVIAAPEALADRDRYRALSARLQRPEVSYSTLRQRHIVERPALPDDMRYPVLIMGQSFGHEASHVEALVTLAEQLAWDEGPTVQAILARLIILIVPMLNPDGREMAIDLWKKYPLGEDGSVAGNRHSFYINRDFLHLTQPEGRAILRLYRDWHPVALYDTHEDAFLLGVVVPEVCWYPQDGVTTATYAPHNIQDIVTGFGAAIKSAWDERGYRYYTHDMFAYPMIGQSPDQPHRIATGNITGAASLHGFPSLITESARTPGAQTWQDRIDQKITAGLAVLGSVAGDPDAIARTIYANAQALLPTAEAFIIPKIQREAGAVASLLNVLLQHEIAVYELDQPEPSYVVPLGQPQAPVIRMLLSSGQSKLVAMPPTMGIQVFLADERYRDVALRPVFEPRVPRLDIEPAGRATVAIPNTTDGIQLVNRLWFTGAPIRWLVKPLSTPPLEAGTFILEDIPASLLRAQAHGLHVQAIGLPSGISVEARLLRRPTVALYIGQGVDRPNPSPAGELWWGLEQLGFDVLLLEAEQITAQWLGRADIVLFPEGNARDIVDGWHLESRRSGGAWDMPGEPRGLGATGIAALRAFVEAGGTYVGFGSGGGLLATPEFAGLIDLTVTRHSLGTSRVLTVQVHSPTACRVILT